MPEAHTTTVNVNDGWVEISTTHDNTGSCALGNVPVENIPQLIEELKKHVVK